MHIPYHFRQFDIRQGDQGPNNTFHNDSDSDSNAAHKSSSSDKNNIFIICAACIIFVLASALMIFFVLRTLRRMDCRPKYLPGKFLKDKWTRWNVGVTYGQVAGGSTANNRDGNATTDAPPQSGAEMQTSTPANTTNNSNVRRDTSVRSVITLPAYSLSPKPSEQVIAREGERGGMDMVMEFPETADEEEARREGLMESLYQIRLQRREELAEREWRRQERREARARGDYVRVEQLRMQDRNRGRNSVNGSGSNLSAALAESRNRGRDRRISAVSYAELGHVRHDGSRIRASSPDSDRRPLLTDPSGVSTDTPDRSSGSILTSMHSRGESYSSYQSGATTGSDADTLTQVQSHATSAHSADHPLPGTDEGDVGALHIPPPDYDYLDWGDAPPYESPVAERGENAPPQLRELTPLPTIHIDMASPISNDPATPRNPLRDEQEEHFPAPHPTEQQSAEDHSTEEHSLVEPSSEAHSSQRASPAPNMSREATTNSFASFGSDFDPEHEALASTKEIGGSPRLPAMNGTARKYSTIEEEEPDYAFNTSTFEQYLPEFSPIGTSEEEDHDDDSISIEAGRGPSKPPRRLDDSRNSYMSMENSVRSSSPAVRLDYPTSNTPQKSALRNTTRRAVSENLRKDAQIRRASMAHKENVDPQAAKSARRDQRRTLSEMHAKVRDSYEGSLIEDERPPFATNSARPTRFGNPNLSHQIADAVEKASQEAYARELRRGKTANSTRNVPNNAGDTGTQQSFLLPDLPNLSELVSGVYEDGTPVYTRQHKNRTTRFVSPPDVTDVSFTREHMPLDAVPIPEDEKALFVSLRLLQDKVSELERTKAETERRMDDMRRENETLKANKSRHKDKHGRSRAYESEEDEYRRDRLASDNQKLDAANLALQNKLDIIERKAQIQESSLKRLNRERDMAVSQLGVAYLETQELKSENENLRQENAGLKAQLTKILSSGSKNRDDTVDSEQSSLTDASDSDSQLDTQRSRNTGRSTKEVTSKSSRSRSKSARQEDSRAKVSTQVDKEISRLEQERADEALFSIDVPQYREKLRAKAEKSKSRSQANDVNTKKQPNTGKQRVKRVVLEEVDVTEPVESTGEVTGNTKKSSTTEEDLTLLSFVDEREIAQLRKTLEEERLARKRRQSNTTKEPAANETGNTTRQSLPKSTVPRKSSLKESKGVPNRPASAMGDLTATSKASVVEGDSNLSVPAERPRRHSDHSAAATSQRRRRRVAEDMTSAYLLPDLTFNPAGLAIENLAKLPEATQRALDNATQHKGKNCTVCKRSIPGDACDHTEEAVKIPKPIPVSERMPEPSPYNEEPTMRPAQAPELALATVLKALEDELAHLKMQLVTYQAAYNKMDASLSKRQRKTLGEKIEKVLQDIDMKADQIYALYDVLEGQKQDGREMTEQEMEVTLQSIGIDAGVGRAADVTGTTDRSTRKGLEPDYDEDDELPWEGFENPHATVATAASASHLRKDPSQPETQFLSPTISLDHYTDNEDDEESFNTAIHDGSSAQTRILAPAPDFTSRRLSVDIANSSDEDSDDDDDDDGPSSNDSSADEKTVSWFSLPHKSQLAILTIARLSEPLTQTSLQAYMFYQLKSFDPSLPDSTISTQAGILQGSFTAAQFLMSVWWGRLADAEWMGRKRVLLIGLFGTSISCLGFGFSKSFVTAAVFRTLGGVLNSNVGVMRTMIAEIIEEKKYQSRAFLLLPMCFNIGVIIGPVIGGALADPLKSYPHLFGPGTLFGGEDGVGWMRKWPFALPNVLSAIFIFISVLAVFFGLDETHEVARYRSDWGRKLGRRIARSFSRRGPYYRRLTEHPDDESMYIDGSVASRSNPSSPLRSRARPPHKRASFGQIWTPNVLLTLLAQFLLAFHTSAFNSLTFTFLPTPRAPEGSRDGWFRFGGGLGLPSSRVGMATAIIGIIGLPLQIFVYPRVQGHLGTLRSFRWFLPFSPLAYALMPFLLVIPRVAWLVWPAFTFVVGLQVVSRTFALPAAVILVSNSVSDPSVLGTINGIAQSVSSGARTLGPFLGGWGLGLGLEYNFVGGIWWALALESLVGWLVLFFIFEGKGIEKRKRTEEIEEPDERR
ncbi:hypothetical protein BO70DRAFT_370135 [Aspergillus heteromorphus CBS 117.55]|uniref:Major facilitator superfamily (MFS) profile domain-containing protein n=1 Tax=Aspergillus heteromorphus CBS 117.55 TaxID=1448321 RepID=A0A317WK42_9EURO|nr:uncharacterized protein BO70DRAFT_370135 [Aspergillus heteromorphus CBS 117.55]PWY86051.1 hypothetical protein BO70DRAFT_370135 [Aspergillus heteromorphus CBS 117.55]